MFILKGPLAKHILSANLFPFLLICKFALLVIYEWLMPGEVDLLGTYTLILGLTNSFYIFAGMRARLFVLQSISLKGDLLRLCIIMAGVGIVMTVVVIWLNLADDLLLLILLVAGIKFLEMFVDAFTSFIQKTQDRQIAFRIINQHAFLLVLAYLLTLPYGLGYAIAAECLLLTIAALRQIRCIRLARADPSQAAFESYSQIFRKGVEFTLSATLNAAQFTYFIYYSRQTFEVVDVFFIAKLLAVQAILSRFLTSNNIYFKEDVAIHRARIERIALVVSVVAVGFALSTYAYFASGTGTPREIAGVGPLDLFLIGIAFSLVNITNISIREHILMVDGPRRLAILHSAELLLLCAATYLVDMSAAQALIGLIALRFARILMLTRLTNFPGAL